MIIARIMVPKESTSSLILLKVSLKPFKCYGIFFRNHTLNIMVILCFFICLPVLPLYYTERVYSPVSHDFHDEEKGIGVLIQVAKVRCSARGYCGR
jgi:hypothetical protein